ncbi:hypothetical protein [Burkholderia pyrrocinia]|uniref:D-apionate lactonase n=1 Tax=Burkholderia pyrrocinia TaxID=60550 RepID=UPI002AB039B9|nr:hypothetical protein [Burkholderia pyrrocinia]
MNASAMNEMAAYYGTVQPESASETFEIGRWSFDVIDGALRTIRFDGIEIIRAVSFLVRDKDWGTCRPSIRDLSVADAVSSFRMSYAATCVNPDNEVVSYEIDIACDASGKLECRATYQAQSDFLTARCGFCVLHPISGVAGAPVQVTHNDGSVEVTRFPTLIDPWQPFQDIKSIEHQLDCGLAVRCTLLGDVFEMEDQRNWSDASFKTYSRPLALPWPYVLETGAAGQQSVRIEVAARSQAGTVVSSDIDGDIQIEIETSDEPMPQLGVAIAPEEVDSALANLVHLTELAPQRLTLQFDPLAGHGKNELARLAEFQRRSNISAVLEYVLLGVIAPRDELTRVAAMVADADLNLSGIFVTPAVHRLSDPPGSEPRPSPAMDEVYSEARRAFPNLSVGGGMFSYFAELNRKRPPLELVDWVTHATCPIVHAADDRSVMESLEAIPHITRSCRALIGTKPYMIGPISIGMRQNPYGSRTMPNQNRERIAMASEDPRDHAQFGAAWLAGYIASLAGAHVDCVTLGGFTGPRGVVGDAGQGYPVFAVARLVAGVAGSRRVICRTSRTDRVTAFGAADVDGNMHVLVANMTGRSQVVRISGGKPVTLGPFACEQLAIVAREAM